jgi:hypothetical protein
LLGAFFALAKAPPFSPAFNYGGGDIGRRPLGLILLLYILTLKEIRLRHDRMALQRIEVVTLLLGRPAPHRYPLCGSCAMKWVDVDVMTTDLIISIE